MKTLVAVGHIGSAAHTMELQHTLPLSDAWLTLNSPAPPHKMWSNGELVDDACFCDGTEDGYYSCSYPPCVVERDAEAAFYGAQFRSATAAQEWVDRVYEEKPYKYGVVV